MIKQIEYGGSMKRITVMTSGRQDWGILRNPVRCLAADPEFDIDIIAGGMACDERYGNIVEGIRRDEGFDVSAELKWDLDADTAVQTAEALKLADEVLKADRPDAVMLLGDRFETLGFAQAAFFNRIPIIHLHGGEETEGALDNQIRHAVTKLSSYHFVSCGLHAERVMRMGEDPERVFVVGAPGLDNLHRDDLPPIEEVLEGLNLRRDVEDYLFLITYHPPTVGGEGEVEFHFLLEALEEFAGIFIFTVPNNDEGGSEIYKMAEEFVNEDSDKRVLVKALGEKRYWSVLKAADAVIGNSSSGIIEAPAVPVSVVNIGTRQKGRGFAKCIIDVPKVTDDNIVKAVKKSQSREFRAGLRREDSIFGDGHASEKIRDILKKVDLENKCNSFFFYEK